MAYTKSYSRINWKNYPNEETPINENNLNRIDGALDVVDDRTVELEATKVSKLDSLVASVEFIEATGVIKVTYYNGSVVSLDTKLEKIAVNFDYDKTTQKLVITLDDGTKQYIDLSSLITELEFVDSSTIGFEVSEDGTVRAKVLNNSIGADQLDPIYLTTITNKVAEAEASADEAKSYAVGGTGTREGEDEDNAKYYSEVAKQYGANVIDDTKKASNSTYSSEKIEDLVSEIIDDTATATGKTYSSEKIEVLLGDIKAEDISYDNTKSQLQATNAQDAVDEINGNMESIAKKVGRRINLLVNLSASGTKGKKNTGVKVVDGLMLVASRGSDANNTAKLKVIFSYNGTYYMSDGIDIINGEIYYTFETNWDVVTIYSITLP